LGSEKQVMFPQSPGIDDHLVHNAVTPLGNDDPMTPVNLHPLTAIQAVTLTRLAAAFGPLKFEDRAPSTTSTLHQTSRRAA
jgi:hypothetical protein